MPLGKSLSSSEPQFLGSVKWEAQCLPPWFNEPLFAKEVHSGLVPSWRLGERGRTFSESPHVSVYACCGSLFQDPISAPSWIRCSSLTAQDPAWPTTGQAQGQQVAHLHPNGTWRPPLLSPLGSLPPSPSFFFSDRKGHPGAQLKLEASGVHETSPTLVRRCPQGLGASHPQACLLLGEGSGYLLFSQPGGLRVPTLPHEWGTSPWSTRANNLASKLT